MKSPIFVRELAQDEQDQIQAGLRSSEAFVLRRCQILLASARGERACVIAEQVGCDEQTVRKVIKGFNQSGLSVLHAGSRRPHRLQHKLSPEALPRLEVLLHRRPTDFGKDRQRWSLPLLAQVCLEQGLIHEPVSGETIRQAILQLGHNWKRVKHWISSSDPLSPQKKPHGID
jgi:transposase